MTTSSSRPSPVARPARRLFWADARFFVGLALIAASVAGVWWVVSAARQTVPVLQSAGVIVPGETLAADDLRVVEVALGAAADSYLAPHELAEGQVATRTISEGELVPRDGVEAAGATRVTTVVVKSAVDVPAALGAGPAVELWESPALGGGEYDAPRVLVADAIVGAVVRDGSVMGSSGPSLELVIDRAKVADVLAAVSAGSALSAVPHSAPLPAQDAAAPQPEDAP
jgi:hypothetical protein